MTTSFWAPVVCHCIRRIPRSRNLAHGHMFLGDFLLQPELLNFDVFQAARSLPMEDPTACRAVAQQFHTKVLPQVARQRLKEKGFRCTLECSVDLGFAARQSNCGLGARPVGEQVSAE